MAALATGEDLQQLSSNRLPSKMRSRLVRTLIGSMASLAIIATVVRSSETSKQQDAALLAQFKAGGQITCTFPGKSLRTFSLNTLAEPTSIPAREVLVDAFAVGIKNGYCSFPDRSPS